ncbi:MAG: hypothetical protein KGL39_42250 [Patescibacteria group bacterium]|nr:hypothetical protein [Patescibacteria group bacterium]
MASDYCSQQSWQSRLGSAGRQLIILSLDTAAGIALTALDIVDRIIHR